MSNDPFAYPGDCNCSLCRCTCPACEPFSSESADPSDEEPVPECTSCCACCSWDVWCIDGALLHLRDRGNVEVLELTRQFPVGMPQLFAQVFRASSLTRRPHFVWLVDAHGRGGFHAPGLVAIGARDIDSLANTVWSYLRLLTPGQAAWARAHGERVWTGLSYAQIWWLCVRVMIAHELGHARQLEAGERQGGIADEDDADVFAGRLGEAVGTDAELAAMVMHAMGCRGGRGCTHSDPPGRVTNYRSGREIERTAMWEQLGQLRRYG